MPAKFPVANFKSQSEYHQYLESLTHPQLKKVATALNKILRKEYLLSTKKPKDELLADVKRLYSFNSESKLLTLINSMGIDTQDLPGPSMNAPKPTKKQAAEGAKVQAQYEKVERAKAKLAAAKANREAKAAEQLRIKEEEAKAAEQLRMKEEESTNTSQNGELKSSKSNADADKQSLIDNWGENSYANMDIYLYRDYIKVKNIQRFVNTIKKKGQSFAINFMADKLPIEIIDEVYNKYGLKTLLIGLTNISAHLFDKDYPMFWDSKKLPKAKMNKEFQSWYSKHGTQLKNYDNIIKTINREL